jgi:hypothetical protein
MAVIDTERTCGSRPADGANAVLVLQQHVVISQRHAVAGLEPRPSARGRTIVAPPRPPFRILRRLTPPRGVDLVPACPAEAENVHASALVRTASRTGDAGAGGHGRSKLLNGTPQDCRVDRNPPRCTRGFIGGLRHSMSLRGGLTREADDGGRDEIGLLLRFPAKWEPVRRRKRAKRKESRAVSDSNESETALAREERGFAARDLSQTPGHDCPLQGNATSTCPVAPRATSTPKRWSCTVLDDVYLYKIRVTKSTKF